jgi:16S rRNA processing protein RimM
LNKSEWISIAVLGRPRGIRGELVAIALSDKPDRFSRLTRVRILGSEPVFHEPVFHEVENVWHHGGVLIFKFAGIDSIDDAELLRGAEVQVPASERVELDEGEFFHSDLVGCELRDRASGRPQGRVTAVQEYGGPVLLEIDGGRMLVPFVKAICTGIYPDRKLIETDLPEGLEDLAKDIGAKKG